MEYPTFLQVLAGMLSDDPSIRKTTTDAYNNLVANEYERFIHYTIECLKSETSTDEKLSAAIFFKNSLIDAHTNGHFWSKLSLRFKYYVRDEIFLRSIEATDNTVKENLIAALITILELLTTPEDDQFIEQIFKLNDSKQPHLQIHSLKLIYGLMEKKLNYFNSQSNKLLNVVDVCMSCEDSNVRTQCLALIAKILTNRIISADNISACVPTIMKTMTNYQESDPHDLKEYLHHLIDIAENRADLFKMHGSLVLYSLVTLALNHNNKEEQQLALEVLLCIAHSKPILARKIPNFIDKVIEVILHFMLDIENEVYVQWLETGIEPESEEDLLYYFGEESIDRLAKAFYDQEEDANFFPTVFNYLQGFLGRTEWNFNFVAIMCIAQTAEYIPEEKVESYLAAIMQLLLTKLQDKDWRVRFAACHAIGQISLDHQPHVQDTFQAQVLPLLIKTLDDSSHRVQAHGLAAFINFSEEVAKNSLMPHVEHVMHHLTFKLSNETSNIVLEQAVSAIAVIAGVIGKDFMIYQQIIPYIISITQHCIDKNKETLRGKAIECVSIIGLSVGMEQFGQYSKIIMDDLVKFYAARSDNDEAFNEYVQHSITRMCRLLGDDFLPYIPEFLPSLIEILTETPKLPENVDDFFNLSEGKELEELKQDIFPLDNEAIENQEYALEFIKTCAEVLEIKFSEYLTTCAEAIFQIFISSYSYSIRYQAISAMVYLIKSARKVYEINRDATFVTNMITNTLDFVFTSIDKLYCEADEYVKHAFDSEYYITEASSLDECLNEAGPGILTTQMVNTYTEKIFQLIQQSFKTREQNKLKKVNIDDEDDVEDLNKENDQELDLSISLIDILGTLMKHYKNEFFTTSITICTDFIQNCRQLATNGDSGFALLGILISAAMFDNLEELVIPLWNDLLLPLVFECITVEDPRIRQPANYSLGKAAEFTNFLPYADKAIKALWSAAITYVNKTKDQNKTASDSAFASIGRILMHHYDVIENPTKYLKDYLDYLPLKDDEFEGKIVHKELMNRLRANDFKLIGPDESFKKKIFIIFVEIYKTPFSTETLDSQIQQLFEELGQNNLETLIPEPNQTQLRKLHQLNEDIFHIQA